MKVSRIENDSTVCMNRRDKYNPILDIVKFVMSILIVIIHTSFLHEKLYPWLRVAVPLFFMISSYLFFSKLSGSITVQDERKTLMKFTKRNLQLYAFWFVVLFPLTLKIRGWYLGNIFVTFFKIIRSFFLGSTFVASWFIMAMVIAIWLIYYLSKVINSKILLWATFFIYVFASCLYSSYVKVFPDNIIVSTFYSACKYLHIEPSLSFPVALFWVFCGKCFADGNIRINMKYSIIILMVSSLFLYLEWDFIKEITGSHSNDCYIFLAPMCIGLMSIIIQMKFNKECNLIILRKMSTIIYALHGSIVPVSSAALRYFNVYTYGLSLIFVLCICFACCFFIFKFERIKLFSFLKYAY